MADYVVFEHPAGGWNIRADATTGKIEHHASRRAAICAAIEILEHAGGGELTVIDAFGQVDEQHLIDGPARCRRAA